MPVKSADLAADASAEIMSLFSDAETLNIPEWWTYHDDAPRREQSPCTDKGLAWFVQESWKVLEPSTKLDWNWHIDAICQHIEAALMDWLRHKHDPGYKQRLQNLLINVPPGSMKSRVVNVCAPAWFWLYCPSWKGIFLSANPRVALRDSVYCRDIIQSDWYQSTFRPWWTLRNDQNAKSSFWNTAGGTRNAFGFGSRITGDRADGLFWDDPHDAKEVVSPTKREGVIDRWDSAISNRVNDLRTSVRIGIMQRLHELDLSGHVLKTGLWEHLCIPQEYEHREPTILGWQDPRDQPGQLMFPLRFPPEVVTAERLRLGSYGYAGQHQQRPTPAGGGMFKIRDWRLYRVIPKFCRKVLSIDCTFDDTEDSDYVVISVVAQTVVDGLTYYYVPYRWRKQADIIETERAIKATARLYPECFVKLVESKANGPAIIKRLKTEFSGMEPYDPGRSSKVERAAAIQPIQERGAIALPIGDEGAAVLESMGLDSITIGGWWDMFPPDTQSDSTCIPAEAWVKSLIDEFSLFPAGANDDQVDSVGQGVSYLEVNADIFQNVQPKDLLNEINQQLGN